MQFDMIRLVLVSRAQTSLFEVRSGVGERLSREVWLRRIFGRPIVFSHMGSQFHYVPQTDVDDLLSGLIGRQVSTIENEPPEAQFREPIRSHWLAAILILDPSHHEDAQKLAFEAKCSIGRRPISVIRSLCKVINALPNEPYVVEASTIINQQTF